MPLRPPRRARCSTSPPTNLGVAKAGLTVKDGVVSGGGKTVTYGALIGDKLFNVKISGFSVAGNATTPTQAVAGSPGTKPVSAYTIVGTSPPRIDIPDKVTGKMTYVHNIRVPGMVHGRIVRPRGQGAYGDGTSPKILSVDDELDQAHQGRQGRDASATTSSASSPIRSTPPSRRPRSSR